MEEDKNNIEENLVPSVTKADKNRKILWGLVYATGGIGLITLIIFIFILFLNFKIDGTFNATETGVTGDFIGGVVGTFWSMTGILLFYLAITYQRDDLENQKEALKLNTEELSLQREELKLQRLEMTETRKVVKEQSETMKLQKFETTFFNLIRNHSELIEAMYYKEYSSADPLQGYEVLNNIYENFENAIIRLSNTVKEKSFYISSNSSKMITPQYLLDNLNEYHNIAKDTILIMSFIQKAKIKDDNFYYLLLNNSLSKKEKELLGFYLEFRYSSTKLEKVDLFKEVYSKTDYRITKDTLCPPYIGLKANEIVTQNNDEAIINALKQMEFTLINYEKGEMTMSDLSAIKYTKNEQTDIQNVDMNLTFTESQPFKPFETITDFSKLLVAEPFQGSNGLIVSSSIKSINLNIQFKLSNKTNGTYLIKKNINITINGNINNAVIKLN